jgi:predicted transcriptional regulator
MTKEEITAIFERAKSWPLDKQQEAASILLSLENEEEDDGSDLTEEDWADLNEGLAEADRGEFATDEEIKELFDLCRR